MREAVWGAGGRRSSCRPKFNCSPSVAPVAASVPATRMYALFPTRPAVALATPMTARYSRPALDFLSHCEFRGMTPRSMENEPSVITTLFLPRVFVITFLPLFTLSAFYFYLSLILHSSYALSFLSHVPLTCIPSQWRTQEFSSAGGVNKFS